MLRLLVTIVTCAIAALCLLNANPRTASAQADKPFFPLYADMPPGVAGAFQRQRVGPVEGYFQPIRFAGPAGAAVALATAGEFAPPQTLPHTVGVQVGPVYRLRVSQIPRHEGFEVFPTVELIGRLFPPPGLERKFALPIYLAQEDLEAAIDGRLVTRVVYLEDPKTAIPVRESSLGERYVTAARREDPLQLADVMGRPLAIVRMGSRVPPSAGADEAFLFGSPPWVDFDGARAGPAADGPNGPSQNRTALRASAGRALSPRTDSLIQRLLER